MAFEEITPGTWIPKKAEDSIEGVFIKAESDVGPKKSMMYHLDVDEKRVCVWGCAILDQRMEMVKPGEKLRITFKGLGEAKNGNNAPKIFKVEVDRE